MTDDYNQPRWDVVNKLFNEFGQFEVDRTERVESGGANEITF